jgi:hypothetical protein
LTARTACYDENIQASPPASPLKNSDPRARTFASPNRKLPSAGPTDAREHDTSDEAIPSEILEPLTAYLECHRPQFR